MASKRRGPHPQDQELFAEGEWGNLRQAVADFSWLKSKGYGESAACKLVGDHYDLRARQRAAMVRSSCSDGELAARRANLLSSDEVAGCEFHIDGFNILTTIEAVLGGGVILRGRDGCIRDMSSMHGNYRVLSDTQQALKLLFREIHRLEPAKAIWYLDKTVSNSGRLKGVIEELAAGQSPDFDVEVKLVPDPDVVLKKMTSKSEIVVSADRGILDFCGFWFNLASEVLEKSFPKTVVIDFRDPEVIAS